MPTGFPRNPVPTSPPAPPGDPVVCVPPALGEAGAIDLPGPIELVAHWASETPLAAWVSGDAAAPGEVVETGAGLSGRSRWSVLAVPTGWVQVTDERSIVPAGAGVGAAGAPGPDAPPFVGGWIGWLGYDLGRRLEPTGQGVRARAASDRDWPLGLWLRCPGAMVHDAWTGRWQAVGEASSSASALAACVASARAARAPGRVEPFRLETPADPHPRERYEAGVREALARIGAGEVFQVNLARRLSAPFTGDTRALFAALCARARPRFGCYAESVTTGAPGPAHAVLSLSPELFLEGDLRTGEVATRPMKGTRPITGDARELFEAGKDRAELAMIVDLMRNDLGRVARFGSVRVAEARSIERHAGGGVLQAVAEVRARLREGVTLDELLRATFPPGSVTGAPKIRAMRLIDELEASRRGPYCGASGFISDHGRFAFNVAIRTAGVLGERGRDGRFRRATLDYSVGAGIVADSVPGDEYDETAQKAWAIRSAGGARPGRALGGAGA